MVVTVPHKAVEMLFRGFLRWAVPLRPEDALSPGEMTQLADRVKKFERKAYPICMGVLFGTAFPFGWAAHRLDLATQPPTVDSVCDTRELTPWLCTGFFAGSLICLVPWAWYQRRWWKTDEALYLRYEMTRWQADLSKIKKPTIVGFVVLGMVFAAFAWREGEVVDANGMRFWIGAMNIKDRQYSEVSSVTVYSGFIAPIGSRVNRLNLEVRFNLGPPLRIHERGRWLPPDHLERIAKFISEKSGQPVTRAGIRP